jgi:hypothetical protein
MSKRSEEEILEFKREYYQETLKDARHEQLMYSDEEYALEYYGDKIADLAEELRNISNKLYEYGHIVSAKELFDLY